MTEKGEAILLGREGFVLRVEASRPKPVRTTTLAPWGEAHDTTETRLFEALRKLRRKLAQEQGLAAYMVFADRTLMEMAAQRPATMADLRAIHGVGERKAALYGEIFLEAIGKAEDD